MIGSPHPPRPRESACLPADMPSSLSFPSELKISDQAELDDLLIGMGQDARHDVRSLVIEDVRRVGEVE